MNILDKIISRFGYYKKAVIESWEEKERREEEADKKGLAAIAPAFGEAPPTWRQEDYLQAADSWVYACVSTIADEVATIVFRLYKRTEAGEIEEVNKHCILNVLYRVNDFTTKFDHLWLTQEYLELVGEAPWLVGKDKSGVPVTLYLLRPDRLTIKWDEKTVIGKYEYQLEGGRTIDFKKDDIIFLRYPDPLKPLRGKGPLAAAVRTVDLDKYAEQWNVQFFYNSARPDAVVSTEQQLTEAQVDRLREQWEKLYKGVQKYARVAILHKGLQYKQMQISQKDMDFLAQQKFSRDKILSIFRVPRPIVGITEDVNRANAEVATYTFARWTIRPKMQKLVDQLNEFFIPMFPNSENLFLDFDDPVQENIELSLRKYGNALKNGWMTPNEVRKLEKLSPIEGGDSLFLPMNYAPIGAQGEKEEETEKVKKYPRQFVILDARNIERRVVKEKIKESIKAVVKAHLLEKYNNKPKGKKVAKGLKKVKVKNIIKN